ncbi:MAG: RNA polymerase sigma-54 factor [Candidatus Aminicenantes bacterium RBG_19FT_COMBO_58_17]|nr:MAG: RNA polymerase sigma-54 factor [Candidatus Aminicenantes bacterium RBG_19FT_COMBO_58_17]
MLLKQRLDQRQVQKLILAPALQQAIKLLPLTNLELIEIIDSEVSQNPMLEEETQEKPSPEKEGKTDEREEREAGEKTESREEAELADGQGVPEGAVDLEFESHFQEYFDDGFRPNFSERREVPALESVLSKSPSLWDHLNWQANLTFFEPADRETAQVVIGNINEEGYLSSSEEELAKMAGVGPEKIQEIRQKIRMFDPVGAGSVDLREALLAQMDYLKIDDEITRQIVHQYLPLLERSDFAHLARILNVGLQDIKNHIEVIKRLDPTPGRKYSQEKTSYAMPDIVVTKEDNELNVSLNDEGLPRLRINAYYRKLLARAAKENVEAYQYLKDKLKKALWFLRSLDQRDQTVFKVAKYIVDRQREFFEKGIDYIKPLTLMEIAREIGVHESTVGRVVANKFMTTPWGVFPLKYFFHKSLVGDFGEEISSLKVKEKIKKLVEGEDRGNPLSDIEIEDILAKNNLKIARRTVAKYRKQLKIPPSHIRKRRFAMEGSS